MFASAGIFVTVKLISSPVYFGAEEIDNEILESSIGSSIISSSFLEASPLLEFGELLPFVKQPEINTVQIEIAKEEINFLILFFMSSLLNSKHFVRFFKLKKHYNCYSKAKGT